MSGRSPSGSGFWMRLQRRRPRATPGWGPGKHSKLSPVLSIFDPSCTLPPLWIVFFSPVRSSYHVGMNLTLSEVSQRVLNVIEVAPCNSVSIRFGEESRVEVVRGVMRCLVCFRFPFWPPPPTSGLPLSCLCPKTEQSVSLSQGVRITGEWANITFRRALLSGTDSGALSAAAPCFHFH